MTIKILSLGLLCGLSSLSHTALSQDGTGLKISAAVDTVGTFKANKDSGASDEFIVREAEILLTAPIDQLFQGQLSFAAHREEGLSVAEVHEAFISTSKLIPRSNIRVGQFFLGVGRLNRFHRHEWPMVYAPRVHEAFFGAEGALDSGIEYSYLAPLPFYLEATVGVTNGWTYGHSHNEGEKPKKPTHYGRLATYLDLPLEGGAQVAYNFLSRTDAANDKTTLNGIDLTAKWRGGGVLNFLLQGEAWLRDKEPHGGISEKTFGAYLLPQYAIDSQLFLGVLADHYTVLTLKDITGKSIDNSIVSLVPTVTYKASEFSTLRVAYDWQLDKQKGRDDRTDSRFEFQANFIVGAHPAHDF